MATYTHNFRQCFAAAVLTQSCQNVIVYVYSLISLCVCVCVCVCVCPHCSAGKPKKAGALMTICLMLGPDFISDQFVVETSDHARLRVALAMNNYFIVSPSLLRVCVWYNSSSI